MLTVREAFEKAGYPVPRDSTITIGAVSDMSGYPDTDWFAKQELCEEHYFWHFYDATDSFGFRWYSDDCTHFAHHDIDLSNLPAIDCYDALPDVVKKVVKP